jgi:putative tricarboxylic transport membrane protein
MSEKQERRPDGAAFVIAAILAGIALVIIWQTMQMRVPPVQAKVGPTVFPYIVAGGLLVLAAGTVVSGLRQGFPARTPDRLAPIGWVVGGLVAQILLLSTAGFSIATGVLFALTAKGFGRGKLWQTIPIGVVFAFLIWFIFARGLQLSLPQGPIERLVSTGQF